MGCRDPVVRPSIASDSAEPQQRLFSLTVPEVLAAISSLCFDQLKPYGRIILKRLRERAAAAEAVACGLEPNQVHPETMPRIDPKELRSLCETCEQLVVQAEEGKEYSAVLVNTTFHFQDVCSQHDQYSERLWHDFATYLENLGEDEMMLPCGRYACARQLLSRQLPFLTGRSLGQVCHIVQLAISKRRFLGHREGQLVPFPVSDECAKEQCAFHQQPFSSKKGSGVDLPVATWEEARACLRQLLLSESGPEPGAIALSDVKRLFRRQFSLDLSETMLGHMKVCDLLMDTRFWDICIVEQQGNGQVMVRRADSLYGSWQQAASVGGTQQQGGFVEAGSRMPLMAPQTAPASLVQSWDHCCQSMVQDSLLQRWQQVPASDRPQQQGGRLEAGARVPQFAFAQMVQFQEACCFSTMPVTTTAVPPLLPIAKELPPLPQMAPQDHSYMGAFDLETQALSPGATPRSQFRMTAGMASTSAVELLTEAAAKLAADSSATLRQKGFMATSPVVAWLVPEDSAWSDAGSSTADVTSDGECSSHSDEREIDEVELTEDVSPSILRMHGLVVKNTFIDIAPTECESPSSSRRRAHSTPKSIGSTGRLGTRH